MKRKEAEHGGGMKRGEDKKKEMQARGSAFLVWNPPRLADRIIRAVRPERCSERHF